MMQVTKDLGLAYDFAKKRAPEWFTAEKLAVGAKIKLAAAQKIAVLLAELRIFDCNTGYRPRYYQLIDPALPDNAARIAIIERALHDIILPELRVAAAEARNIVASEPSEYPEYRPIQERRSHRRASENDGDAPSSTSSPRGPGPTSGGPANQNVMPASDASGSTGAADGPAPESPPRPANSSGGGVASIDGHGAVDGKDTRSVNLAILAAPKGLSEVDTPPQAAEEIISPTSVSPREKVRILFEMIRRPEGATLDELALTLGNQPHSVRATISVKSREQGLKVECVGGRYFLRPAQHGHG